MLHVKKASNHIKSLVVIGSVSQRWHSQGTRRASLSFACLSIVQSCKLDNTSKYVKDALKIILRFLYCLGLFSIKQILFVIYLSLYLYIHLSILSIYLSIHLSIYPGYSGPDWSLLRWCGRCSSSQPSSGRGLFSLSVGGVTRSTPLPVLWERKNKTENW